jgi:hypothetical protein
MDQTMTFTVADVRKWKDGTTQDGRRWEKYLIRTQNGELIGTFESEWLWLTGMTVTVAVKETVVDGKVYRSVVKPPNPSPGPAVRQARQAIHAAPRAQDTQTALAVAPAVDAVAFARLEASVIQLLHRLDAMAALCGDTAEGVRGIAGLLERRLPPRPEDDVDEEGEPDLEDPGPTDPPDPDDEPAEGRDGDGYVRGLRRAAPAVGDSGR